MNSIDVPERAPESKLVLYEDLIPIIARAVMNAAYSLGPRVLMYSQAYHPSPTLDCPGTQSEQAGKASACEGCPNQTICVAGLPKGPDPGANTSINPSFCLCMSMCFNMHEQLWKR